MWSLNKWYEKVVYVIGWIAVVFMVIGFVYGFISGAVEEGNRNSFSGTIQVVPMTIDLSSPGLTVQRTVSTEQLQPADNIVQTQ